MARRVRAIIIPATQHVYKECLRLGYMDTFIDAGCVVSTPTCRPCLGGYMGVLAEGERCVATTNRNFVGRMGHTASEVYLASPAVAAASAIAGHIASHGSKYNRADIYAVLMQTVDCMREMLLEGKRIEMGDLGVFSISIQSRGAENLETFNPAIHIEQLNVNWTPGDRFRNLLEDAVFNLVPSRRAARIPAEEHQGGRDHRGPDGRRRRRQRSHPAHRGQV